MRAALALVLTLAGCLALGYGGAQALRSAATVATTPPSSGGDPSRSGATSTGTGAPTAGPDLTALAEGCPAIPSRTVAAYLQPATLIHGTEPDPRTQQTLPVLRSTFDAEIPTGRPPFSITAVVQEAGKGPSSGQRPIDASGSLQLWMYWDGDQLHKGVRHWTGSAWAMAVDNDAGSLTIELRNHSAAFHSSDVKPGATFAIVTADANGCAALGLDSQGRPASGF